MKQIMQLDKCRGSLAGGAIGDALGYEVEFMTLSGILKRFGEKGITRYVLYDGEALFSDDTQMTLYTSEALLESERSGSPLLPTISDAYLAWYGGQTGKKVKTSYHSELSGIKELNQQRAPGNTCLSALCSIYSGKKPNNRSKGCGGVMRVAPIGIYGASRGWTLEATARTAGEAARMTHLHPLSTYSSAALAVIVEQCILSDNIDAAGFESIVNKSLETVGKVYGDSADEINEFNNIVLNAMRMSESGEPDREIIRKELGEGWVADETLAIAIFSVARHLDDFTECMICAVNHDGDSDSTGAVAGNIIGAIHGYDSIPDYFKDDLQLRDLILSMADALGRK